MKLLESKCILGGQGGRMQVEGEAGGTCAARNGLPMEGSEVGKEVVILLKIMLFVMVLNLLVVLMK